jgi:hypothetical protein
MAAAAAPPERETITFSDTFPDEFLTEACGVEVTTTVNGRITFLTFPDRPVGPQDLTPGSAVRRHTGVVAGTMPQVSGVGMAGSSCAVSEV